MNYKRKKPRTASRVGKSPQRTWKEGTEERRRYGRRMRMLAKRALRAGREPDREVRTSGWLTW